MTTRTRTVEESIHPEDRIASVAGRPMRAVRRLATWPAVIISGICFAVFATVFFATSAPFAIPHVEEACGAEPLDVRLYSSAEDVERFLDGCGEDGRAAYRNLQIADLAYPTVFGVFMTSALALSLARLFPSRPGVVGLAALGMTSSVFDYAENALAWRLLTTYPEVGTSGMLLGFASAAKTITGWTVGLGLLTSVALLTGRAVGRLVTSSPGPRSAPTLD